MDIGVGVGEIVWGKLKGWPAWPARIKQISANKIEIVWFNDYRRSYVFKNQIFKFHANYEQFSKNAQTRIGLETAIKEAVLFAASRRR